jgi:HEAT repeat protein
MLLKDRNVYVRRTAIEAIEDTIEPVSISGFIDLSGYIRWHQRWQWKKNHQVLERGIGVPIEPILSATKDEDAVVRVAAIRILGMLGERTSLEPLLDALHDDSYRIQREVIRALGMLGTQVPVEVFVSALEDENWEVCIEPLIRALHNQEEERTRAAATIVLGMLGERSPVELLLTALGDTGEKVRAAAVKALSANYPEVLSSFQAEARAVFRIIGFDSHRASEIADELSEASSVMH